MKNSDAFAAQDGIDYSMISALIADTSKAVQEQIAKDLKEWLDKPALPREIVPGSFEHRLHEAAPMMREFDKWVRSRT